MAEMGQLRPALAIGIFEFRRSVRSIWADKARFGMMAGGIALPAVLVLGFLYLFRSEVQAIGAFPIPAGIRGSLGLFWLFAVFIIGQRVVVARSHIEAEAMMLTSVSTSAVAGGLMVAETLRAFTYFGLYAIIGTGIAVVFWGSLPGLVVVPLAVLLFAATAVVVGSACGYAVAWLVATSPIIARHKTVLGSVGSLVLMSLYFILFLPQIHIVDQGALAWLPTAWLVDLAAVGSPATGSTFRAGGAVLGSALIVTIGSAVVVREAAAFWHIDPVSVSSADDESAEISAGTAVSPDDSHSDSGALAAAVKPIIIPRVLSTPTRNVAEWTLLRARREPNRLTFVLMPLIAVSGSVFSGFADSLNVIAAPAAALVLSWLAGAVFALNPLGDEGSMLPVTLTAISGKKYVRGLITPGIVLGIPICVAVTAALDVFSPYSLGQQVGLIIVGIFLTCIAATITPAIGMAMPRFSAFSVGRSDEVLPPRISAMAVHLLLVIVPGAALAAIVLAPELARDALAVLVGTLPAFVLRLLGGSEGALTSTAGVFEGFGHTVRTADLIPFRTVSVVVLILGGTCVGWVLYYHAIRRFDRLTPS